MRIVLNWVLFQKVREALAEVNFYTITSLLIVITTTGILFLWCLLVRLQILTAHIVFIEVKRLGSLKVTVSIILLVIIWDYISRSLLRISHSYFSSMCILAHRNTLIVLSSMWGSINLGFVNSAMTALLHLVLRTTIA